MQESAYVRGRTQGSRIELCCQIGKGRYACWELGE